MNFTINKCVVLQTCFCHLSQHTSYHLNDHILECVKHHSYLGSFSLHSYVLTTLYLKLPKYLILLNETSANVLHQPNQLLIATSLVRPILEYASSVWDSCTFTEEHSFY